MTSRIAPAGLSIPEGSHSRVFSTLCLPFPHSPAGSPAVLHQGFTESAPSGLPSPSPRISGSPTVWGRGAHKKGAGPGGRGPTPLPPCRTKKARLRAEGPALSGWPEATSPQLGGRPWESGPLAEEQKERGRRPSATRTPGLRSSCSVRPFVTWAGRSLRAPRPRKTRREPPTRPVE